MRRRSLRRYCQPETDGSDCRAGIGILITLGCLFLIFVMLVLLFGTGWVYLKISLKKERESERGADKSRIGLQT